MRAIHSPGMLTNTYTTLCSITSQKTVPCIFTPNPIACNVFTISKDIEIMIKQVSIL
jgi:hypothetical protein